MSPDVEQTEDIGAYWRVADLVGLEDFELANVSPILAGSAGSVEQVSSLEEAADARTIIMSWGDERLNELLGILTERIGYPYGAENWGLIVILNKRAMRMDIIPKVPVDVDDARGEDGEVDGIFLALINPEQNPQIIFYDWDAEGGVEMQRYFDYVTPGHFPWVKMENYWLRFSMSMDLQ